MKFEIKGLKIAKFASEETFCYAAKVYVNGVYAFDASNEGHGGSDNYYPVNSALFQAAVKYAAGLPPLTGEFGDVPYNLDLLMSDLIAKHENDKWVNKTKSKGYTVFILPDEKLATHYIKAPPSDSVKKTIFNKYPNARIL